MFEKHIRKTVHKAFEHEIANANSRLNDALTKSLAKQMEDIKRETEEVVNDILLENIKFINTSHGRYHSGTYHNHFLEAVRKIAREKTDEEIKTRFDKLINNEELIDELVARVNRKQLK